MRRLATITISLALVSSGLCNSVIAGQSRDESSNPGLRLAIMIVNQKSCDGNIYQYAERLDVETYYTNEGKTHQILFMGSDVPTILRVARTPEDLKLGKYEVEAYDDVFPADASGRYLLGEKPENERSVVLEPGGSTAGKNSVVIFVRKPNSEHGQGLKTRGTHFFQVGMMIRVSDQDTGSDKVDDSQEKNSRFRWITVLSQPVKLEVPENPKLQKCSKP